MTRPVPPRPTLLGAPHPGRPARPDPPAVMLRMLSPPDANAPRPTATTSHRRRWPVAVGLASLIAVGSALTTLHRPTAAPPRPPDVASTRLPVVAPPLPPSPAPAVATIESVAPLAIVAPVAEPSAPPAPAVAAARRPTRTPDRPPARPASARPPSADADVDLLAALVSRLQAADPVAVGASAASVGGHRPTDAPDDSRAAAR